VYLIDDQTAIVVLDASSKWSPRAIETVCALSFGAVRIFQCCPSARFEQGENGEMCSYQMAGFLQEQPVVLKSYWPHFIVPISRILNYQKQ